MLIHSCIKNYIQNYMKFNITVDDMIPEKYQEVIRQIVECSMRRGDLSI